MDNTRAGRDNLEIVEGLGAPLEELESFAVTLEFSTLVKFTGASYSSHVNLDGVVND